MSQHDYVIDNASGAAVRADLNNALSAIVTSNSAATAPSTTYAYQVWADTTANKLKIRNGANNAWFEIGSLDTANLGLMLASYFPNVTGNVTATQAELNIMDGCNSTTAELNLLQGKTSLTSLSDVYPVGSIYINATNASNPSSYFGFGTWVAFGTGRVMVGLDSGDADFNTAEETGGSKTDSHVLTINEIPAHTHNYDKPNLSAAFTDGTSTRYQNTTSTATTSTGGGAAHTHDIVQPYIVVYMWKRTA